MDFLTGPPSDSTSSFPPPLPPAPPFPEPSGDTRPFWKKKRFIFPAVFATLIAIGAATESPDSDSSDSTYTPSTVYSGSVASSSSDSVPAWAARQDRSYNDRLTDLLDEGAEAAGDMDLIALASACSRRDALLTTMLSRLDSDPPPDATLEGHLRDAYTYSRLAAQNCVRGARNFDVSAIEQSTEYEQLSSSAMSKATARLKTF